MPNPHIPHHFGAEHHRFQQLWESLTSSQAKLSSWQELPGSQGFLCPCFPKYLAGIANKQIFPQTLWPVGTGCEQLPTKTSSSFRKPHPSNPSVLGSCLRARGKAVCHPRRDGTGSPGSRWERGAPGGKSGEEEVWEKGIWASVSGDRQG